MPVMTVGDAQLLYTLKRSDRARTARITVTPGSIDVVVPVAATDEQIAAVLHRRREWLLAETRRMATKVAAAPSVARFVSGAKIPYRGRLMRLRVEEFDGSLVEVAYRNGFMLRVPRGTKPESRDRLIESALRLWLKQRLRRDALSLARRHGEPNGLKPRDIRIKDQKHLWGSCGADRIVNLNWQLVFAPMTVLEYAVVHELCHLRHRNHEPEFWSLIATILPDWRQRKDWLDRNEHLLALKRVEAA